MRIFVSWPQLNNAARLVMVRMAVTALDQDKGDQPAALYFAGWMPLAKALGVSEIPDSDPSNPEVEKIRRAAQRAVERSIAELVREKAIERIRPAKAGQAAVYRIHPDGPMP